MTALQITAGRYSFDARLERELAPRTCAAFEAIHAILRADCPCALVW